MDDPKFKNEWEKMLKDMKEIGVFDKGNAVIKENNLQMLCYGFFLVGRQREIELEIEKLRNK